MFARGVETDQTVAGWSSQQALELKPGAAADLFSCTARKVGLTWHDRIRHFGIRAARARRGGGRGVGRGEGREEEGRWGDF